MRRALAVAVVLAPVLADACPVCAQDGTPYAAVLIGGMIVAPYAVAALVVRAVRAAGEDR